MKRNLARIGALVGAIVGTVAMATPALATPPTNSTGYDESPNVVLTGGSDTSYFVSNLLTKSYNQSPGCSTNNSGALLFDACVAGQAALPAAFANWDHDVITDTFPYGSGSGRSALANAPLATNGIDIGRSSSGLGGTGAVNSLFEFASEGIAVVSVLPKVGRTTGTLNVTQAQLAAVYENNANAACDNTVTWAQVGDTNAATNGGLLLPFGMNPGSGTFGTFNTFVGNTANTGECVVGQPFENDVAELGKANATATQAAMVARRDSGDAIWWISGAVVTAFPVLSAGLSPMNVGGLSFTAATYALRRNISYVTRDSDAAWCTAAGVPVNGCAAASTLGQTVGNEVGKPGAVREFVRWVCRTANQAGDPNTQSAATATSYLSVISGSIQRAGFSTTVTGTNTLFGRCRAST
jgi:hypothetical protein